MEEIMSFVGGLGVSRILAGRFRKQVLGHFPGARLFLKASDRELAASGVHGKAMEALVRKVNDKVVVKGAGGPNQRYSGPIKASLKKGWNAVLVRAEPGTSNWNFGLAIDDFDGLEFSAEPR